MKKIFILVLAVNANLACSQQLTYLSDKDSSIIRVEGIYKGQGKIFTADYVPKSIELPTYNSGYNLKKDDILKIENIIKSQSNKNFKRYWRQYFGFIDINKNILIFIHLDKLNKNTSELTLDYWRNTIAIVNTEWDEDITADFIVDMDKGILINYFLWLKEIHERGHISR